jgi:hypothetical protein
MAEQPFWQRLIAAVNREYERRVRAASLVGEYGADHHGSAVYTEDAEEGEVALIANVPRGTLVAHSAPPADPPEASS